MRPSSPASFQPRFLALLSSLGLLAACGGSSGGIVIDDTLGTLEQSPDGRFFFVDPNQRGQGSEFRLAEAFWARLVDVYEADGGGVRGAQPIMRRAPVRADIASDGVDYRLESDALGREALVVLHAADAPEFEEALAAAMQELPALSVKHAGSPPPFTTVARNSAIVLRFDDLLLDGAVERAEVRDYVHLVTGYPPSQNFLARVAFDDTHGDTVGDVFHPTRLVIDMTVSAIEIDVNTGNLPLNAVGLPASVATSNKANVELRLPTQEDFAAGQFGVLRNLRGRTVDPLISQLYDPNSPTVDVVRALRSGNDSEPSNGFLPDETPPALIARWPLSVTAAFEDPEPGFFRLDLEFLGTCGAGLRSGALFETGDIFLEVANDTAPPDGDGRILDVRVRGLAADIEADDLLGSGRLFAQFDDTLGLGPDCWIEVDGEVGGGTEIEPDAVFTVRFNESMERRSLDPLETLRLYQGAPDFDSSVVAVVEALDGASFELAPVLPLSHVSPSSETYTLELLAGANGAADLAGNVLTAAPAPIDFNLRPGAATLRSGGLALRFASANEFDPAGNKPDLRGQFTYETTRGELRPRAVVRQGHSAEGQGGPTSLMLALPVGIREPLVPFGSRLQTLWRYADFRWAPDDESLFDVDVEGIGFAPFGGAVVTDFFQGFEVRLGHSVQLPDEAFDIALQSLVFPSSGLFFTTAFDFNVIEGAARVVHPRDLGYRIRSADLFSSVNGTPMLPLPLDTGGRAEPFVWRDTTLQVLGGFFNAGVPITYEGDVDPEVEVGSIAPSGGIPSFGLPLLMEFRCFPSDTALGQNAFQTAAMVPGQLFPTLRVHTSGGITLGGVPVRIDPDEAEVPAGGFNPNSVPQGSPSRPFDPAFYFGQLDTVTRVTRVFTVWLDSGTNDPDWVDPLMTPLTDGLPQGTSIELAFRGVDSFSSTSGAERDAAFIDAYGELLQGQALFPSGDFTWKSDIDEVDSLRHLQVRMTFVNDTETGFTPTLDALAIAFRRP